MTGELTAPDNDATAARRASSTMVARPAELVELSERMYRAIFGAGLCVAVLTALYSLALVAVQVGRFPRALAAILCLGLAVTLALAARHHQGVYRAFRRRPGLCVPALAAGLAGAHVAVAAGSQLLFPVTLTLVGLLGCVVAMRWVLLAGLIAAAGQASPILLAHALSSNEQRALLTAAVAEVFIPLIFSALVAFLAHFMLNLHHTLTALDDPPARQPPRRVRAWTTRTRPSQSPAGDADPAATATAAGPVAAALTPRQLQAVALAAEGLKHAQIADCLATSTGQVTRLLAKARERTGAATTQQLVAWLTGEGTLPPTP